MKRKGVIQSVFVFRCDVAALREARIYHFRIIGCGKGSNKVLYSYRRCAMNFAQDIQPVTYLKGNAAHLLQQVNETRRPVIITQNGLARAVLQDTASYESMKNAIAMLTLMVQGENDIRADRLSGQEEVFTRIEAKLVERRKQAE
jgi:prevent-host-death family protein